MNVLTTMIDVLIWGAIAALLFGVIYWFSVIRERSSWLEEQSAVCYRQSGQAYLVNKTLTCYRKNDYTTPIFKITYPEKKKE
jgi:hypothetical protein